METEEQLREGLKGAATHSSNRQTSQMISIENFHQLRNEQLLLERTIPQDAAHTRNGGSGEEA